MKRLEQMFALRSFILSLSMLVVACSSPLMTQQANYKNPISISGIEAEGARREVVMYALGLLDVAYQFGGANPEAGLDCSGMVGFIYKEALGVRLPHNAAALAAMAQAVEVNALKAGDLVFFNTQGFSFSHVGIYLGDGKFIHAPSSKGSVRVELLSNVYFSKRFEGGRSLL